jgi:hypothetical protein
LTAPFKPTPKQRELVELAAGCGLKHTEIARFLKCDVVTMYKYFRRELDIGKFKLDMVAANTILKSMGGAADERVRLDAARFYAARRMGWKEAVGLEHTGADGGAIEVRDVSAVDLIRSRIEEAQARLETDSQPESLDMHSGDMPAITTDKKTG